MQKPPNLNGIALEKYNRDIVDDLWFECVNNGLDLEREKDPFWAKTPDQYFHRINNLKKRISNFPNVKARKPLHLSKTMFQSATYYNQIFLISTYEFQNKIDSVERKYCEACNTGMFVSGECKRCDHCRQNHLTHEKLLEEKMLPIWRDLDGTVRYDVPEELQDLTFGEMMMLQRYSPYIALKHIYSGSFGLQGHCCCYSQDIGSVCNTLPKKREDLIKVIKEFRVTVENTNDPEYSSFVIRKKKVLNALKWLKKFNEQYKDITISEENLDWMGDNEKKCIIEQSHDDNVLNEDDGHGIDNQPLNETVAENQTGNNHSDEVEFYGVIPEQIKGVSDESAKLMENLRNVPSKKLGKMDFPHVEEKPVSEYNGIKIFTNVFPWLFPGGEGDVWNEVNGNLISKNQGWAWASKLLNWKDGRFMKDKTFIFYALDMLQRHKCNSSGAWFMKTHFNESIPNFEDLKEKIQKNETKFIEKIQHFSKKIEGSDSFWRSKRDELYSWMEYHLSQGNGAPNLFMTLSCAENWWPEIAEQVAEVIKHTDPDLAAEVLDKENMKARYRAIVEYTNIVQEMFQIRTEEWLETVGKTIFKIQHYWLRFEFAKGRGQIHAHLLAITSDGLLLNHNISRATEIEKVKILSNYARNNLGLTAEFPLIGTKKEGEKLTSAEKKLIAKPEGTALKDNYSKALKRKLSECTSMINDLADNINMTEIHVCNPFCMRCNKMRKM